MDKQKEPPSWAKEAIEQLGQVEIMLGNIPKGSGFLSDRITHVMEKLTKDQVINDETAEFLFNKIVKGMREEGFLDKEIAEAINKVVCYEGGPKYCDETEVGEV